MGRGLQTAFLAVSTLVMCFTAVGLTSLFGNRFDALQERVFSEPTLARTAVGLWDSLGFEPDWNRNCLLFRWTRL